MLDRFMQKVMPEPNTGCWYWTGCLVHNGYGQFWKDKKHQYAHRVSYEIHNGEIPGGMFVCHTCDERSCVNPDHLFLGTNIDNMEDMKRKGRSPKGEKSGKAKLTEDLVRYIRSRKDVSERTLAKELGISRGSVHYAKIGWGHVQ